MAIAKLVHLSVVGGLSGDDLEWPTLVHLEFPHTQEHVRCTHIRKSVYRGHVFQADSSHWRHRIKSEQLNSVTGQMASRGK